MQRKILRKIFWPSYDHSSGTQLLDYFYLAFLFPLPYLGFLSLVETDGPFILGPHCLPRLFAMTITLNSDSALFKAYRVI
jgi:hypothetical protein